MSAARGQTGPEYHETSYLLLRAAHALNGEIYRRLRRLGYEDVRAGHAAVFSSIDDEGSRITELAKRAGMTKQSMGELVLDLEGKGYVERGADPVDARAKIVRLTQKGRKHLRDSRRVVEDVEQDVRRRVGDRRVRDHHDLLRWIAEQYGAASREGGAGRGRAKHAG